VDLSLDISNGVRKKALVLLATMGEVGTIDSVLQEIAESFSHLTNFGWQFELLVVDDGHEVYFSDLCNQLSIEYRLNLRIVKGPGRGLGAAMLYGFDLALQDSDIAFVINLDADGQHDARQIGDILRGHITTQSDITIGSRWTRGGRCYGLSFQRRLLSRLSGFCLHLVGVPRGVKDATTSFRVYGRKSLELISRDLVGFDGFSFFGASIAIAHNQGLKISEIPIHFRPRLAGNSNLKTKQIFTAARDLPAIHSICQMVKRREKNFYRTANGEMGPDQYSASRELELLSNTPKSTRIILDLLKPYLGPKVLEVGAGLGQITNFLSDDGYLVTALEPDTSLFHKMKRPITAICLNSTLENALLRGHFDELALFDSALYVNVLEHIENDIEEITIARRMIKEQGTIVIFVPALPRLYGSMDAISSHYRRYRKKELVAVMAAANLEVEKVFYFDSIGVLPYWISYKVLNQKTLGSSTVKLYDNLVIPMSLALSRLLRNKTYGKNLVIVAKKLNGSQVN